jgi:hypothetical protein
VSKRKHYGKRLVAAPPPDTTYAADSFSELSDQFVVVAVREPTAKWDVWRFTFDCADVPRWHAAMAAGTVTSAQQLRNGRWYLLGKLVA